MATLHIGKLTDELKTTVTPQFKDLIEERARKARCNPSDLMRDALYLVFSELSFTDHVANDRRAALKCEDRQQADNWASE